MLAKQVPLPLGRLIRGHMIALSKHFPKDVNIHQKKKAEEPDSCKSEPERQKPRNVMSSAALMLMWKLIKIEEIFFFAKQKVGLEIQLLMKQTKILAKSH